VEGVSMAPVPTIKEKEEHPLLSSKREEKKKKEKRTRKIKKEREVAESIRVLVLVHSFSSLPSFS